MGEQGETSLYGTLPRSTPSMSWSSVSRPPVPPTTAKHLESKHQRSRFPKPLSLANPLRRPHRHSVLLLEEPEEALFGGCALLLIEASGADCTVPNLGAKVFPTA